MLETLRTSKIIPYLLIFISAFLVRCSDGLEVLVQPDKSVLGFSSGNLGSADLVNLEASSGTLEPGFGSDILNYSSLIDSGVSSITVTPTAKEDDAAILVNGVPVISGQVSGGIPMVHGENMIAVDVTSSDGIFMKTYDLTVVRCDADNADLIGLALSDGTLAPAFATGTYAYTAYVDTSVGSITVTPAASEDMATIRVNGTVVLSGQPSEPLSLKDGENTIRVEVLSFDGSVSRTYTVTVIKCGRANADLSNLALSTGTLAPAFAPGDTAYTTNVHLTVPSITMTPTAADPYATIEVNSSPVASGQPSGSIGLYDGVNAPISVVVTSPDGTVTKTYTVTVTRLDMQSTNLKSLAVADQNSNSVTYSPGFTQGQTSYTATVDIGVTSVTVTPAAVSEGAATITVNGTVVPSGTASGAIALAHGDNVITVHVTNGAFTPQTYTMTITRLDADNSGLSGITLSNGTLSPAFSSGTTSYNASVTEGSVTVTPTAAESYASVLVNGIAVAAGQASQAIPMNIGNNTITVAVRSYDSSTTTNYTIIANRAVVLTTDFVSTKSIRLDTTSSGSNVAGTVTNFPVLLRITDASIIDAVRSGAPDIRFRASGGTSWLSYEIERWDQANNRAEVWVLVPSIAGNGNTYITMYYNDVVDGSVSSAQDPTAVFSTSNGFAAVYHMNENPAGGSGAIKDRTANANNGTSTGSMTSSDQIEGQIAGSIDFDGTNDAINLGTSGTLQPANLTASFWVKKPGSLLGFFIYRNFLCMKSSRTGNGWYMDFSPGLASGVGAVPFEFYVDGNNNGWVLTPTLVSLDWLSQSTWVQMSVTFDTGTNTCRIYMNGELQNGAISGIVGSPNTITATSDSKYIAGGSFNSTLNGGMDEIRISSTVRSADWVKLEYENQKTDQSLVHFL